MSSIRKLVFVSDAGHLSSTIAGGVQVCTSEYVQLLKASGFAVEMFPVAQTRKISTRVKIKLGIEVYERYECNEHLKALTNLIDSSGASCVALNQVALMGFAPLLKARYGNALKILILSHGNESGDYLHEVVRIPGPKKWLARTRDIYRLGSLLYKESSGFTKAVDLLLCLSDTEVQINNWLGASRTHFIPRTFAPCNLRWDPVHHRVGFVGSLSHKPNFDGFVSLVEELEKLEDPDLKVRLVGGPIDIGEAIAKKYSVVEFVGALTNAALEVEAATWSIFLNPVFWYSRGASTKLATGMNWGIPVISTPAGNRGYCWREGGVMTVNTPEEMALACVATANNRAKLQQLAEDVRAAAASGPSIVELANDLQTSLVHK